MEAFRRAIKDTFKGQITALAIVVIGGLLSLAYLYVTESRDIAVEEIPYVQGTIFGALGSLSLLFMWNLACGPYRNEREKRLSAESRISQLEELTIANSEKQRKLSPAQVKEIADLLRGKLNDEASLFVLRFANEECTDFSQCFLDAFRLAGYNDSHSDSFTFGGGTDPTERDLEIIIFHSEYEALTTAFSELLTKYGFTHKLKNVAERDGKEPFRLIVHRPS